MLHLELAMMILLRLAQTIGCSNSFCPTLNTHSNSSNNKVSKPFPEIFLWLILFLCSFVNESYNFCIVSGLHWLGWAVQLLDNFPGKLMFYFFHFQRLGGTPLSPHHLREGIEIKMATKWWIFQLSNSLSVWPFKNTRVSK